MKRFLIVLIYLFSNSQIFCTEVSNSSETSASVRDQAMMKYANFLITKKSSNEAFDANFPKFTLEIIKILGKENGDKIASIVQKTKQNFDEELDSMVQVFRERFFLEYKKGFSIIVNDEDLVALMNKMISLNQGKDLMKKNIWESFEYILEIVKSGLDPYRTEIISKTISKPYLCENTGKLLCKVVTTNKQFGFCVNKTFKRTQEYFVN
jgi:hypothetical protein